MDGVITDTARVHAAAWTKTFDEFLAVRHAEPFHRDDYLRYVDGVPRDAGVERFLASRGITLPRGTVDDTPDADTVWGLANRKNRDFLDTLHEQRCVRVSDVCRSRPETPGVRSRHRDHLGESQLSTHS